MKTKTLISLKVLITLLLVVPAVVFSIQVLSRPGPVREPRDVQAICNEYKILSQKEAPFDAKVTRLFVVAEVDRALMPGFGRHFEYGMTHALELNGIEAAVVAIEAPPATATDCRERIERCAPEAVMHVDVEPVYGTRPDGREVMLGAGFSASLTDAATGARVWSATGEEAVSMDWIRKCKPDYGDDDDGDRKKHAFQFAEAISTVFVAEINGGKPARIYTATEDRLNKGQPVDLADEPRR